jgi:plasmid stabilization system protein ParE
MKYSVFVTETAQSDIERLTDYIAYELKAPLTSLQYTKGIVNELHRLKIHAESISISSYKIALQFGENARHVNYKNHTIIYTVSGNIVMIERIIASSMIVE